jgi:precorrin-3B synthase
VLPAADIASVVRGDRDDRCPGVLRLIDAQDGRLARVRLPGGLVSAAALTALAEAAVRLGDGRLELTSRGNVQLRGLAEDATDELIARLTDAGLQPSPSHELVRNIVASPLAGIDNNADLTGPVRTLDGLLCADPRLAQLPGRFLFGLDDGRGDVAASGPDLLAVVTGTAADVEGLAVTVADMASTLIRAAHAFLDEREAQASRAWHVAELRDGRARVRARLGVEPSRRGEPARRAATSTLPPIGRIGAALVVAPPLGRLTADQAAWLASNAGGHELRITPGRRVVLPLAPARADPAEVGLVTDPASPWLLISACAGRPRCAKALADVQADAAATVTRFPARRVHWSGCERRCGRTPDVEVDVVATAEGYAVHE